MDNYKIKVNDEAESKEAQELFFELGYSWLCCGKYYNRIGNYTFITAYPDEMLLRMGWGGDTDKELTLPQLRDLVVLKRNDASDANYTYAGNPVLKLETQDYKVWDEAKQAWLEHVGSQTDLRRGLKAIPKRPETANGRFDENGEHHLTFSKGSEEKDPALISGADALRALADGKEVERKLGIGWCDDVKRLSAETILYGVSDLRLKPQTIKLELELPKPFEPKMGENYWFIDSTEEKGYRLTRFDNDENDQDVMQFGAWRTEDEIKQVVEQLRKIRGAS
ncbi:hypothetical protein QZK03_17355 [Acinetobacter baumannii]|nr:hypothetical protein [Acinetobacter baumannii]